MINCIMLKNLRESNMKNLYLLFSLFFFLVPLDLCASSLKKVVRKVAVGSDIRTYIAFVPVKPRKQKIYKLVVGFHPRGATNKFMETTMDFHNQNNVEDFVFAYPQGYGKSWNGLNCCGPAHKRNIDDIKFTKAIIQDIRLIYSGPFFNKLNIDEKIYVAGFSNGAVFAFHLSCQSPSIIAAVTTFGATTSEYKNCQNGAHPFLFLHGKEDKVSRIGFNQNKVKNTFQDIGKRNGCGYQTEDVYIENLKTKCKKYKGCAGASLMCLIDKLGHSWPGAPSKGPWLLKPARPDLNANKAVMDFFKGH